MFPNFKLFCIISQTLCLPELEQRSVDSLMEHTERCVSLAVDAINAGDDGRPLLRAERVGDAAKDTVCRESDRTLAVVLMCRCDHKASNAHDYRLG